MNIPGNISNVFSMWLHCPVQYPKSPLNLRITLLLQVNVSLYSPRPREGERSTGSRYVLSVDLATPRCFMMSITDINREYSPLTPNQPPQLESNFGDSSEPLFSMYTKAAEDEDNKMVERWQRDADGILIFVSLCLVIHIIILSCALN